MESDISSALTLLGIGMITVFVVLLLVVVTGNVLIMVVNRLAPTPLHDQHGKTDGNHIAAITAAVEVFTQGKGNITRIEKEK